PFYCFKGSFDRFELTFRTFEDVFHCSVIKVRSVFQELFLPQQQLAQFIISICACQELFSFF
ncbi:MAG TPA: hypothetical protein H9705_06025, partial [Candidatus Fusicatenibacter intestinigallinarum]|nr:hypothetical protein [Candidatus Fusicatenibacter intestinigallinarum]